MKVIWQITGECDSLEGIPEGADVIEIDGEVFMGICVFCNDYLTSADEFIVDGVSGEMACRNCFDTLDAEEYHD